jgi:hypothetical protein
MLASICFLFSFPRSNKALAVNRESDTMKMGRFATCGGAIGLFLLLAFCLLPSMATDADKDPSISHATLLLPHATSETKISYTIEAFNGCFKWLPPPHVAALTSAKQFLTQCVRPLPAGTR